MAREELPQGQARPSDLPSQVSVTVTAVPGGPARMVGGMRAKLSRRWVLYAGVALAAAIPTAALVAHVLPGTAAGTVTRAAALPERVGAGAVAAAFGYPERCLSITVSAADPDYASVHVDRTGTCANYRGYVNASFHRVDGVWRLMFDEGQLFVPNSLLTPLQAIDRRRAAASDYPLGCVSVAIALHDPRFARADFDRGLPCGRDRSPATAAW